MKKEIIKYGIMKKIWIIFILAGLLTGCYDEFVLDFPYTTVSFSTATGGSNDLDVLNRTVVKGEGLKLDFGCYLAGVLENKEERWADFTIDASLLSGTPYTLMPASMYSLSNDSRFVIPKGEFLGTVTITLDSAAFLNDPLATDYNYAIPFRLTGTSADSINTSQSTKIVAIKYINHYEGYYIQTGTFATYDASDAELNSGAIDNVLEATTFELDTVILNGTVYSTGNNYRMKVGVGSDNSASVEKFNPGKSVSGKAALEQAAIESVTPDGTCEWDPDNNKFVLNYKVTYTGETYYTLVSTELAWRNRIRDGVNEWRR